MNILNSKDFERDAQMHERNAQATRDKIKLVETTKANLNSRIETDIRAAQAEIAKLEPYKDEHPENAKTISDYETRISTLEQERDREMMRMDRDLEQHTTALKTHESNAQQARAAHESAKKAEQQERIIEMAHRAQSSDQGSTAQAA